VLHQLFHVLLHQPISLKLNEGSKNEPDKVPLPQLKSFVARGSVYGAFRVGEGGGLKFLSPVLKWKIPDFCFNALVTPVD
jgi:hypothetical protein